MAKNKGRKVRNTQKKTTGKTPRTAPKTIKIAFNEKISLIIPCYNEEKRLNLMVGALKQFDQSWHSPYEVIVVDDGSTDNTANLAKELLDGQLSKAALVEIISLEKNKGKGGALQVGVAKASGDFILTLDADMATSPLELINWLKILPEHDFRTDQILIGSREHKESNTHGRAERRVLGLVYNALTQFVTSLPFADTQCGFKLYPAQIAQSLFADLQHKGWSHDVEILYEAHLQDIEILPMPVTWQHVEDEKINVGSDGFKMVFQTLFISLQTKLDWYLIAPIRNFSNNNTSGESPIYRLLFSLLVVALFFLMPWLSSDYGISGDEYAQKVYGELIVKHFETDGAYKLESGDYKGQDALTMKPNLWLYGGFFDYVAAKVNQWFPAYDDYDVRHFLNALTGFLLIFFVGLLAKEISNSWKMGFFAALMAALSPRIFGHSMMNPKDIPFAAAYIFTLVNIIRIVKQLPRPGLKPMVYTALGIALAISIRIGGLILVGLLGLFVIVAFLWKKDLRRQLTNFPLVGGIIGRLSLVVIAGYFGGLLFWPFGLQAPFSNPFVALSEMTNFSTAIQMLFEGEHPWSDQLPWYYIPKWQMMAAPIAVLVGFVLGVFLFFKAKTSKNELPILLILFAGIFPIVYALLQGSAVYDGMRQFLFVYPIFVVFAAFGWASVAVFKNKIIEWGSIAVLVGLLFLPASWMVKNHPYQYIYINELFGGVENAATQYETDYWMTSAKHLAEWFVENVPEAQNEEDVLIALTDNTKALKHYFKKLAGDKVRATWVKYDRREERDDWDYLISFHRFKNEGLIDSESWPLAEVVYEEKVDGITIGAISKRTDNFTKTGRDAFNAGNIPLAIENFQKALKANPKNEQAWLGLIDGYYSTQDFPKMKEAVDEAMKLSDSYITFNTKLGLYYFQQQDWANAITTFEKGLKLNYKSTPPYYYLALAYNNSGNTLKAVETVEKYAIQNGNIPQAYDIAIQLTANEPNKQQYFTAKKLFFQQDYQNAYNAINQSVQLNPNYEPAAIFKAEFDKLVGQGK